MLILALFMVLFSNHMEERLKDGKSVLRVDCHMTSKRGEGSEDESSSLISSIKVLLHEYYLRRIITLFFPPAQQLPISGSQPQLVVN